MNLFDSLKLVMRLFDAHMERDRHRPTKHRGSKRPRASQEMIRERRKRQRQARRRQRMRAR